MTQEKQKVVLIDANAYFAEDIQRRFQLEHKFEIVGVAHHGMDGYSKVQSANPDYVVIGYPLPDVELVSLLQQIRQIIPSAKVVCALETENAILTSQLMNQGANYVLTKPYTVEKLITIFERLESQPALGSFQGVEGGFSHADGSMQQHPFPGGEGVMSQQNPFVQGQIPFVQQPNAGQGQQQGQGGQQEQAFQQPQMQQPFVGQGGGYPPPQAPQMPGNMGGFPPQQFPQPVGYPQQGGFPPSQQGGFPQPQGGFPPPQMPMGGFEQGVPQAGEPARGTRTIKQTVIAVNCPKGGVGKTTVSKELALAFSTVKVHGQPLKVCLVDCDLDFGDVASMLKLNPYPNISHWTSDIQQRLRENPNAVPRYSQGEIESKYLIKHQTGLHVLAAPSNHTDALDITGNEMAIIIDNLKNCDFDVIILDTGNNTKDYSLIALEKAHNVLMVITLEITSIQDTNNLLQTLRSIQFPTGKIRLVVNKMPKSDKDIDTSEISELLGTEIMGFIPDYPKIRIMNNAGTPAILARPTEFSEAIRRIAHKIIPVFNRPSGGVGGSRGGEGKLGMFGKFFGK